MCPTEERGRDIDFRECNGHILILTQQKKERIGKKERLIQQLPIYIFTYLHLHISAASYLASYELLFPILNAPSHSPSAKTSWM